MEDYILLSIPSTSARRDPGARDTDKMYGAIAVARPPPGGCCTPMSARRPVLGGVGLVGLDRRHHRHRGAASFRRRKYDDRLVLDHRGAPRSATHSARYAFIVYASLTNTSVGQPTRQRYPQHPDAAVHATIIGAALVRPDLASEREPRARLPGWSPT
jgi:hypothetical protein